MTTGYSAAPSRAPHHSSNQHTAVEAVAIGETSHDIEEIEGEADGDDDDDDDDSNAGHETQHNMKQETTVKSGYLEKKGEKRKAWKKRWFVLRSSKLSYYKNDKEYQLLRFIDIGDIKTVASVEMKRSLHSFGIVTPKRTFYVRAASKAEMDSWVEALNDVMTQYAQSSTMTQDMAAVQLSNADAAPYQQSRSSSQDRAATGSAGSDHGAPRSISIGIPGQGVFISPAQPRPIPGSSAFSPLTITSESDAGGGSDRFGMSYNSSVAGRSLSGSPGRIDTNLPFTPTGQSPGGHNSGSELSDYGLGHQRRSSAGFPNVTRQRSTSMSKRLASGAGYDPPASPGLGASGQQILSSSDEEDEWDEEEFADQVMPLPALGTPLQQPQQSQSQQPHSLSISTTGQNTGGDVIRDPNKVITQGYLMKQTGRRKVWRKRWFVLTSSRVVYARSHMDEKAPRQIPIISILDAIEYEAKKPASMPSGAPTSPIIGSPATNPFALETPGMERQRDASNSASGGGFSAAGNQPAPAEKPERRGSMAAAAAGVASNMSAGMGVGGGSKKRKENCFQIITPKRTYILCAPSEDEEIKWLSALKTLINRQRNAQTPALTTPMSPSGNTASSFPFHMTQPTSQSGAGSTSTSGPTSSAASATSGAPSSSTTASARTLSPASRQSPMSNHTATQKSATNPGVPQNATATTRQRTLSSNSQQFTAHQATSSA